MTFGWLNNFTQYFAYGAIIMILLGLIFFNEDWKKIFLRVIATTCCLYPLIDVAGDLLQVTGDGFLVRGQVIGSDVARLSALTGIPEFLLALIFISSGIIGVVILIDWSAKKDAATKVKASLFLRRKNPPFEYVPYRPNDPRAPIPEYRLR